jgi:hypothetical protein
MSLILDDLAVRAGQEGWITGITSFFILIRVAQLNYRPMDHDKAGQGMTKGDK